MKKTVPSLNVLHYHWVTWSNGGEYKMACYNNEAFCEFSQGEPKELGVYIESGNRISFKEWVELKRRKEVKMNMKENHKTALSAVKDGGLLVLATIEAVPDPIRPGLGMGMQLDLNDGSRLSRVILANWAYLSGETEAPEDFTSLIKWNIDLE